MSVARYLAEGRAGGATRKLAGSDGPAISIADQLERRQCRHRHGRGHRSSQRRMRGLLLHPHRPRQHHAPASPTGAQYRGRGTDQPRALGPHLQHVQRARPLNAARFHIASIASLRRFTVTTSMSPSARLGALAAGMIARLNPCFAASRRRSSPPCTGRISPASPISPNTTSSAGNGLLRRLDNAASTVASSAPVSVTRTPPTTFTNTTKTNKTTPTKQNNTTNNNKNQKRTRPTDTRRGFEIWLSATRACTTTSSGRVPSRVTITTLPGTSCSWRDKKIAEGLVTSLSPRSPITNTPSSNTTPKRFLIARTTRNGVPMSPSI